MYKEQIASALKTKSEIKRCGLSNEAIDRIASAREKTVTEESQVETAVTDAETMRLISEELMKMRDQEIQKRTDTQSAFDAYKENHPEEIDPEKENHGPTDIAKLIADGIAAGLQPLKAEIETLKNSSSAKAALDSAKETFFSGEYAKKYKDQADEAWERAVEVNELSGSKMTAEELNAKATGYFNKAVSKLGVDTSQPFKPDKQTDDKGTTDWSAERQRLIDAGKIPAPEKNQ